MQSFRERSAGYHGNQPCYQQEPHELSRLDTYRQHPQHPHTGPGPHPGHSRPGYDTHPLTSPSSMTPGGGGTKDCYSQQAFASFPGNGGGSGNGNGVSAKKTYRGVSKAPTPSSGNHLQGPAGYSNHMGPGSYSAQYLSEGHLQQKWDDPSQLSQYEQDIVARMEASTPTPGSAQYMDQNMLGQTQCHQPTTPAYTSPHHQPHVPNPPPSPLMYPQSHLHYPQQSPSPYMDKCSTMPHCYKGYNMPPNTQYTRQIANHSSLKQGQYRQSQSSYSYQQPTPRGYEPHTPLQNLSSPQEPHSKYQHYNQTQQSYCLTDLPVRSPEQYYQTCSPASSHSPARSVGRSPSYSSTPSPLMTNPESFQYGQPSMTPSSSSSSTSAMQEQGGSSAMLLPPRSHPSPNVAHAAPHSYTSTAQLPTMKERFSEKLLSNPSLWSLNALTSQVENISNNVQQLLLSEALVGNKKSGKRSSGGSNSSIGSGTPSKKSEEYKSPLYADGSGVGGPMQDPYSTTQHHTLPMELHEAGYSSSSDEQLDRGYYYCNQGRSPAQAQNNTGLCLDTASSCSITSPDDMSIRSGDSGVHNLTPDPAICTPAQGGDGMSTPAKSIGDERSPTSITVSSPLKQDRDSPPDIETIDEPLKENFEESTWPDKCTNKNENTEKLTVDEDTDIVKCTEKQEHWTGDGKESQLYSKDGERQKDYCYDSPEYHEDQRNYELTRDSIERSPSGLSFSNDKEQEVKSEAFKSDSRTPSESSVKTLPYVSRGDLEQDQYSTEKEDGSENTSSPPRIEEEDIKQKEESRGTETEQREEEGEVESIQKEEPQTLSPPLSAEVYEDVKEQEESEHPEHPEEFAPVHLNTVVDVSSRETAIGDTAPKPESAMPVFSSLNVKAAPAPAHVRDHLDHSDAKVLEPDSPQLPGKSILPSAPSWADTPPSPKKGDEDIEPGISCASAVTPSTKPEPLIPTAQPRTYGRKHARGRRRMQSGSGLRRQLSLEREGEKREEVVPSSRKPCMPASKTGLISDQTKLLHSESNVSPAAKIISDVFSSRMCTRSFNAPELSPKDKPLKRKPGPKPGPKPKPGTKPGPKPRAQPPAKPGPKSIPKPELKPAPTEPEIPPKCEIAVKQKAGPKPRVKPGPKPGSKHTPISEPMPVEVLPSTDTPAKSTDTPSAKSTDTPSAKSTDTPSAKSTDTPSAKTTNTSSAKTTNTTSVKTTNTSSVKTSNTPSAKTSNTLTSKSTDTPSAKSTDTPSAKTTDTPSAKTTNTPSAKTTDTLSAKSTNIPSAKTTDTLSAKSTDTPSAKTTDTLSAKSTDTPSSKTTNTPTAKSTDTPSAKTTNTSTAKSTDTPSAKTTNTSTAKSSNIPFAKTTDTPSAKSTDTSSAKTTNTPTAKSTDTPSAKITDTTLAKITDTPTAKTPNTPSAKTSDIPSAKTPNTPSTKTTDTPSAKTTDTPSAKTTDTPSAKTTDTPSAKTTNTPSAKTSRPKGTVSKSKNMQEVAQPSEGMQSRRKRALLEAASAENQPVKPSDAEEKIDVKAPPRVTKNMVLRSRKPSQEKVTKDKINKETVEAKTPAEPRVTDVKVDTLTAEQTLTPLPEVKNTDAPAELSEPPKLMESSPDINTDNNTSLKRKTSSPSPSAPPVKKKRGPKPKRRVLSQPAQVEEDVFTAEEVITKPSKRKIASQNKCSSGTSPPNETDNSDAPAQCPTKTKVLPPRKGRGQKYEALVQKMTSPGSKKQQIIQLDNITDELPSKVFSQNPIKGSEIIPNTADIMEELKSTVIKEDEVKEQAMPVKTEGETKSQMDQGVKEEKDCENDVAQIEAPSMQQNPATVEVRTEETQETACVSVGTKKTAKVKKKRWAIVESTDIALEAESLIVTTPRLAKQRAIKNNHEMHLKQRRKKRKEGAVALSEANVEGKVETEQQEKVEERDTDFTAHGLVSTKPVTESVQVSSTEPIEKPKRGRKPSLNQSSRKRGKTSSEPTPEKPSKLHKKPGPKPGMKDAMEVIEAVVRAASCEQAEKEEREKDGMGQMERDSNEKEEACVVGPVVTVSEKQSETICVKKFRRRPITQNSKLSFCPYVRLSNSRDFSSWCAIVNKPEDAVVFQRRRKKGILRMKNPFTVAKGVPHTAAMLQGPLVNKALTDRCLNCSLCGKPANYRDLGDLCGPFYAEDDVPRKILTSSPTDLIREISEEASCSKSCINKEPGSCPKDEEESDTKVESNMDSSALEGSSRQRRQRRYRRPEGLDCIPRRGGLRRVTLRERFRRIQQLKATGTSETEEKESLLQRLQQDAETKEHWAHENCAIWTKGVVMVAGRLYGLKEAAKTSSQMSCYKCQNVGASLSCCWRGCSNKYHYVCAKEIGCTFHEDDFSIKCPKHEDL